MEKVRHREKLGISTREIDSRNPQVIIITIITIFISTIIITIVIMEYHHNAMQW